MLGPARKLKNAIFGAFVGILMIPGSMALQAWNEYRTIHRTHGLDEAEEIVVSMDDPAAARPDLDGKLVHLSAAAVSQQELRDPIFGVSETGIRLSRDVEMYQWKEKKRTEDGNTRYSYSKKWARGRINSESFHRSSGHENPALAYPQWNAWAGQVDVGAFRLSDSLKKQKDDRQRLAVDIDALREQLGPDVPGPIEWANEAVYCLAGGGTPSSPNVGDVRIRFMLVPNGPVSLMAGLEGETFQAFKTSNGETINKLYPGTFTATEVIEKLRFENSIIAWLIRGGGFVLALVGFLLVFGPAQRLFAWIPLVGDFTGGLIFVAAIFLAGSTTVLTISISWIAVRPLLGGTLLVLSIGLIYWLFRMRSQGADAQGISVPPPAHEPIELTDDMLV